MKSFRLVAMLFFALGSILPAQQPKFALAGDPPGNVPEPPKETIYSLTLTKAGPPSPILKYPLLGDVREQTKSNAALLYHRAIHIMNEHRKPGKETYDAQMKIEELLKKPAKDIPVEELRNYVKPFNAMFRELEAAAKCRNCDWELGYRISTEYYSLLLPEMQQCRNIAFLLKVRCRMHQVEGNIDAALQDLQTGYTFARNVGQSETLISYLVGTAIGAVITGELEHVLQHPKCPNLYWSLTALPRPLISLERATEGELIGLDGLLPLPKVIDQPMTPEQARLALDTMFAALKKISVETGTTSTVNLGLNESRLGLAVYITLAHPKAKANLKAAGKTDAELNAMPAAQIVLLDSVIRYRNLRDEYMIWLTMPYEEAIQGMQKGEENMKELRKNPTDFFVTMLGLMLPATQKVYESQVRFQRRIASLRVVEAVRLYAAKNGKAPQKLDDITFVPVPKDVTTGKHFEYVARENGFMVTVQPPPGHQKHLGNAWKYDVTWAK